LFPGISLDVATYADLQKAISAQVASAKLINHPPWNLKVIQVWLLGVAFYTAVGSETNRVDCWRDTVLTFCGYAVNDE